jgi:hypothetical protein
MASTDDAISLDRLRRVYERDRVMTGLMAAWPVGALLLITVVLHGAVAGGTLLLAAGLAIELALAAWRGDGWRRGTRVGLLAGLPALLTPTFVAIVRGEHCSMCLANGAGSSACFLACLTVSALGGVLVGALAARDHAPGRFLIAGVAAAAATGALACDLTGVGGALGVAAGFVGSSLPALVLMRRAFQRSTLG